jgi:hypothetical protein
VVYQIGTTLEQALKGKGIGEVALVGYGRADGGGNTLDSLYITVTCTLFDAKVYNSRPPGSTDLDSYVIPWTGSGAFDIYWMLPHLIFTSSGEFENDFAIEAYKFSSVNFSSETTTIPFSSAIKVAP